MPPSWPSVTLQGLCRRPEVKAFEITGRPLVTASDSVSPSARRVLTPSWWEGCHGRGQCLLGSTQPQVGFWLYTE
jgi:hypothetical protein